MKLSPSCYDCLTKLIVQAASLATDDQDVRDRAVSEGSKILEENFAFDEVSIVLATKIHDAIKNITHNPDPYYRMKQAEIELARGLHTEIKCRFGDKFNGLLKLAALGNNMDFFRHFDVIKEDMNREVKFAIDDSEYFEARLKRADKLIYLADNAGESFFDLPLIKWMKQFTEVIYVVKDSPVQNDITIEDIKRAGLQKEFGSIITTGTATPGVILSLASDQFKREFELADLIFAKGMGYYESLSELPAQDKVFYCLKAKCQPVADSLNVPINSFVAMFW
jgi:uncharacterized protein with ATP-grasp and redox domains